MLQQTPSPQDDARVQTLVEHLAKELEQAKNHADWYQKRAARDKRRFYNLRIAVIVIGACIAFLASLQMAQDGITLVNLLLLFLSLLATVLTSIEALLGYSKSQVDHKRAELELYALLRKYKREKQHIVVAATPDDALQIVNKILDDFRSDYERIVSDSVDRFEERTYDGMSKQK